MIFEDRYVVLKKRHVESALTGTERIIFDALVSKINFNHGAINAVVIEADWPEYAPTCKLLKNKIEEQGK